MTQFARRFVRRGFSLFEILIVVVIIGVLAAIVVPQFQYAAEAEKQKSAASALATPNVSAMLEIPEVGVAECNALIGIYGPLADKGGMNSFHFAEAVRLQMEKRDRLMAQLSDKDAYTLDRKIWAVLQALLVYEQKRTDGKGINIAHYDEVTVVLMQDLTILLLERNNEVVMPRAELLETDITEENPK